MSKVIKHSEEKGCRHVDLLYQAGLQQRGALVIVGTPNGVMVLLEV